MNYNTATLCFLQEDMDVILHNGTNTDKIELLDFRMDESESMFHEKYWKKVNTVVRKISELICGKFEIQYLNIDDDDNMHFVFKNNFRSCAPNVYYVMSHGGKLYISMHKVETTTSVHFNKSELLSLD